MTAHFPRLRTLLIVALIAAPILAWTYAKWPRDNPENVQFDEFVLIGNIKTDDANRTGTLLDKSGIPNMIHGSRTYGVFVHCSNSRAARKLLTNDTGIQGVWFESSESNDATPTTNLLDDLINE